VDEFDGAIAIVLVLFAAYEAVVAILTLRSARSRGEPLIRERWAWFRLALAVIFAMAAVGALFSLFSLTDAYFTILSAVTVLALAAMLLLLLAEITRGLVRGIRQIGRAQEARPTGGTTDTAVATEAYATHHARIDDQDPGWSDALTYVVPFVGPILAATRGDRRRTRPLIGLRMAFMMVPSALLLFAVALMFIAPWKGRDPVPTWAPALVVGQGLLAMALGRRIRRRPLDIRDRARLAESYRSSMWTCIGLSQSTALVAFILVLFVGSSWIYALGLVFALVGIAMAAPTVRDIERRQQELNRAGIPLSLLEALNSRPNASAA
jgi:hypothetical protein